MQTRNIASETNATSVCRAFVLHKNGKQTTTVCESSSGRVLGDRRELGNERENENERHMREESREQTSLNAMESEIMPVVDR